MAGGKTIFCSSNFLSNVLQYWIFMSTFWSLFYHRHLITCTTSALMGFISCGIRYIMTYEMTHSCDCGQSQLITTLVIPVIFTWGSGFTSLNSFGQVTRLYVQHKSPWQLGEKFNTFVTLKLWLSAQLTISIHCTPIRYVKVMLASSLLLPDIVLCHRLIGGEATSPSKLHHWFRSWILAPQVYHHLGKMCRWL